MWYLISKGELQNAIIITQNHIYAKTEVMKWKIISQRK